uniref:28S ribosomal protein S14, mitochondrial n=1 Tax=Clastoptera arizonana TaxID=38151 RepID=A0A1B6CY47_9HEMI
MNFLNLSSQIKSINLIPQIGVLSTIQQVRNAQLWPDWRMKKDVRKRIATSEYAPLKLRINALRKNDILPPEIREIADKDIQALPNDAVGIKIVPRCAITSRPRGIVYRWRLSRIVFRHLADYNKLSGIQRAKW